MSKALLEAVAAHPEWAYEGKLAQVVEETLLHATGVSSCINIGTPLFRE